ncbi:hypothetical protein HY570_04495 [Candidatus Micrarchaeota archaeon]|nr:hypothetical protein [Candidatus Micrarchaeota archaeon]
MRDILSILLMFILVQTLGLYVGVNLVKSEQFEILNVAPGQDSSNPYNSLLFMVYIILGAVFLLFLIKYYKGIMIFRLLEASIIFIASNIVFSVILFSFNVSLAFELSIILSLALAGAKFFRPELRNLAAVLSSSGVGAIFGFSLDILPAILLVLALSVYDILSVFWTRHMVVMAQSLGKMNLSFAISAEKKVKRKIRVEGVEKEQEERSLLELGTGDLAIPLMLSVSAYRWGGLPSAIGVIIFSSIALFGVLTYVSKYRTFLPALPPLAIGGLFGLFVVKLLTN